MNKLGGPLDERYRLRTKKMVADRGKRSKALNKVKPFENINTNPEFSRDESRAKGSPFFT